MEHIIRFALGLVVAVFSAGAAMAQSCALGTERWIAGCQASCTAGWEGGDCPQSCTATAPPGQIIIDHRVNVGSVNNGSHTISRVAAGQSFNHRRHIEQAYNSAINAAAREGNTRYEASLREQMQQKLREVEQFASSHQAVRLSVHASRHGGPLSRKRGWSNASVELLTRCVAPSDLTSQLLSRAR